MVNPGIATIALTLVLTAGALIHSPAQNSSAQALPQWTLGSPSVRIGAPRSLFTEIRQVVPFGDDSILVVDSKTSSLLLFDSRGNEVRRIGRAGQGPGEFEFLSSAGRMADSVWGIDRNRLQFFRLDGRVLSSRPVPRASVRTGPDRTSFFRGKALLSGGLVPLYIAVPNAPASRGVAPSHGTVGILGLHRGDSIALDTLTWLAQATPSLTMEVGQYIHFPGPNHFADTPLWNVSDNGLSVVVVDRKIPRSATSATYRVRSWNGQGNPSFAVDVPFTPVPLPRTVIDTVVEQFTDDIVSMYPSRAAARKLIADSIGSPPYYPPVSNVVIGNDGRIWIARESLVPPPFRVTRYDVMGIDGKQQGFLTLPRPGRVMAATANAVWVVESDADDVPTLLRYPVLRR